MKSKLGKAITPILITLLLIAFLEAFLSKVTAPLPVLQVSVRTEQPFYAQCELVEIYGNNTNNIGAPISAASIALEVRDPNSNTVFLDITTTYPNGSFYNSFRLAATAPSGPYTVYVVASKIGCVSAQNQTTFNVVSSTGMTLDVWTEKASYMRFENATSYGKLLCNRTAVPNATITFKIIFPNQTEWLTLLNISDSTGVATYDFNLPRMIPAGQYRISASSYKDGYDNATATATATFTIQNQEPTIFQASVSPQIMEKPDTATIEANASDYEDHSDLNLMSIITLPNQTTQILNMTLIDSLFKLQYQILSDHPSGAYQLTIRAVDKDAGSCDYRISFEVITPLLKGSASGWVKNSTTHVMPNAMVTLSLKTAYLTYTTTTDNQGIYSFTKILPGQYNLITSAQRYATKTTDIEIIGNQTTYQNTTLQHLPILKGYVTTQQGTPISNATVAITGNQDLIGQDTTNSNGSYYITLSTSGTFIVSASAYGYSANSTSIAFSLDQTFSANFSLIENGKLVSTTNDVISGSPIVNATATLSNSQFTQTQKTNSSGQITFGSVNPGTYTLHISATGYLSNTTTVTIYSNQTTTQQLTLTPTGNITGIVKEAATNSSLQGATATLMDYRGITVAAVHTNSTGGYLFYLVKVANYTLKVYAYGYNTTSAQITLIAHTTAVANFTLAPSLVYIILEASFTQFSRGEVIAFAVRITNAQGQSVADNVTSIGIILEGPSNETRNVNCVRSGDHFVASYPIPNNETMGTWTATAIINDIFGNHGEAVERINILEPFLIQFLTDKSSYVSGERVNFTVYVVRYSNLTRFLDSTEITASLDIRDSQNNTVTAFNLTSSGNALTGSLETSTLPKGNYIAYLTVSDSQGNIRTTSNAFRIVEDFQVTVSTNKGSYNRTETVYVYGIITYINGTSAANVSLFLTVTVKNYPRSYYVATNNSGAFEYSFVPLGIDAGNYTVTCSATIENVERWSSSQFAILGLALNPSHFTVSMPENSSNDFSIKILNIGETALTGFLITINPPSINGATVTVIDSPQNTLAPNDWTTFTFRVTASEGATQHTSFNLTVRCNQNAMEFGNIEVNLYPAVPVVQVAPQIIDTSLAPGEYSTQTITVKNIGYETLRNAALTNPSNSWIFLTNNYLGNLDPQETRPFDIYIHPLNTTNIGLHQDLITITSDNHSPVSIYIVVKISTAENGTLLFRIVDDAGAPVLNAKITLQYQEYWLQAQTKTTNATGHCTFLLLAGGRYSYIVTADNHGTVSGIAIVQPASVVYIEVVSPLQIMSIAFNIMPITIQDEYYVILNMTFAAEIPPPTLIPLPPILTFGADRAQVYQAGYNYSMSFSLQNIGLISVFDARIFVQKPLPDGYSITLGDFGEEMSIDEIHGNSVTQIPCNLLAESNKTITDLENGIVGKIKIEGYYTYFDHNQNSQQAKITAEVLVRICDRGARRLCVNPPLIYGVNRNGVISFSPGAWPSRLSDVKITNCAYNESVSIFTLAVGGGISCNIGIDILQVLSEPWNPFDVSFFVAYGVITRYGGIPGEAITLVDAENTFGLVSIDVSGGPIMSLLSYTFLTRAMSKETIECLDLLPGETAILLSETWDIPTSFDDLFEDLIGFQFSVGVQITLGSLLFAYKWKLDMLPSFYIVPIFMIDISAPSISIPVSAGPTSSGGSGGGIPWQSWWGSSGSNTISPPTITYVTGPIINQIEQPPQNTIHETVKLSISQEATLERDAFLATLKITNKMPSTRIENIRVTLDIMFPNESEARQNFYYNVSVLEFISGVEGTGIIEPAATAVASWIIIPKPGAGGINTTGIYYRVQAHIFYTVNQLIYNLSSSIETINVKPQPFLELDYYLPQNVIANTPFKLAIRVANTGYGIARNFRIDNAQPAIYENLAHLLISFNLIGSYVQGSQVTNSLRIAFGDIKPGETKIGYWLMICSLNGTFKEFAATYTHHSTLGGEETSLISAKTHILMRDVMLDDMSFAFLIDTNNNTLPDEVVHSCLGTSAPVIDANYDITRQDEATISIQTQKYSNNWIYLDLNDPFNNTKEIFQIQRSDGKILNKQNYWMRDGKIHFVDDPEENYTVYFGTRNIAVTNIMSKSVVCQGYGMNLSITVHNAGVVAETFNVITYANTTQITVLEVTLQGGDYATLYVTWNTAGFAKGNYIIIAQASLLLGEINTTDNAFSSEYIKVVMVGDIDPDNVVDIFDIVNVAISFGAVPEDPNWNPVADINNDGIVDIFDIVAVALHFGEAS